MDKSKIRKHVVTLGSGILLGRALGFGQGIILARLLGASELGKYAVLISVCGLLFRFNDFGLPHAFSYFARKYDNSLGRLLNTLLLNTLFCALLSVATVLVLRALPLPLSRELRGSVPAQLVMYAYLVVGTCTNILPVFLMATGEYRRHVTFFNMTMVLQIAFQYLFFFLFGAHYLVFFGANLAGQVVMAVILLRFLIARARAQRGGSTITAVECYRFGLKAQVGVLLKLFGSQSELPVVSAAVPTSQAGQYALGNTFREIALLPMTFYSGIFQNMLIDKRNSPDPRIDVLMTRALVLQLGIGLCILAVSFATLPFLIPFVYGPSFKNADTIANLLMVSAVFYGLSGLCWMGFTASGKPQLTSLAAAVSGLPSPFLIYFSAVAFGVVGAGWASIAVSLAGLVFSLTITARMNGLKPHHAWEAARYWRKTIWNLAGRN